MGGMVLLVTVACLAAFIASVASFECPADGLFPDPVACNKYYNCGHGIAWSQECAEGLVFDPNLGNCDWPENYDCGGSTYTDLKCFKNPVPQQFTLLERKDKRLDHYNYKLRTDAVSKCFNVAKDMGFEYFAVGNKGQCRGSNGDDHKEYGSSPVCPANGKGKYGIVNVYKISESGTLAVKK